MTDKEKLMIMLKDCSKEIKELEEKLYKIRNTRWEYLVEYTEKYGKE
jgi:hypothetical protein